MQFSKVEKLMKDNSSVFRKIPYFFEILLYISGSLSSIKRIKNGLLFAPMLKSSIGERFRSSSNIGNGHCPEALELVRKES